MTVQEFLYFVKPYFKELPIQEKEDTLISGCVKDCIIVDGQVIPFSSIVSIELVENKQ